MLEFLNVFHPADIAKGFVGVTAPFPLLLMFLGVIVASFFAAAPGIGGLLLLSLLMPYAMTLDPFAFIALIFGAATVGNTANTFTSVLIGVPGGSGSQATILDGYPLAKMGQANRALGAAFFGSLVGAFIGALAFIISLPFFKPLVLSLGSPEFLMMVLLGLSAVAILGGKQPVKGLISATVGMSIALIGTDARTAIERFTFGTSYLWDGVSLIIIAMGMFAVPEMVDIFRRKTSIAEMEPLKGGQLEGVKDVFRHWWLVVRSSIVGVWVGVLPGLGSSVADWFAYAHAMQTEKNTENFGKGDIRGVIAPESANNAKEGGDLIPTLLFGIPGGSSMAIILIGMTAVGIQPGTAILTHQAPYMYGTIWTLVIANTVATLLSMIFVKQFCKACMVPYYYMIPSVFLFCIVGAYGNELDMYDLVTLLIFSALGIIMRRYGWPRPPLLVAVVLGAQVQQYLWLSVDRYGLEWMTFPSVIVLGLLIVVTVAYPFIRNYIQSRKMMDMDVLHELVRSQEKGSLVIGTALIGIFIFMIVMGTKWPLRASLPVYFIAGLGLFLTSIQIVRDIMTMRQLRLAGQAAVPFTRAENILEFRAWLWLAGLVASCAVIGFHLTFVIYPLVFGYIYGATLRNSLYISVAGVLLVFGIFDYFVGAVWPNPIDDFIGDGLLNILNSFLNLFRS
ncbi:MAG TPA: tripartite tricarboxylate transporter permease [Xanthobacteraceae bacterium]|nr:tripartite tricarboxylate transporter permease [Xanthobacteraceae bacterium]